MPQEIQGNPQEEAQRIDSVKLQAEAELSGKGLFRVFLQSLLLSLPPAFFDFAVFYLLLRNFGQALVLSLAAGKALAIIIKFGFFKYAPLKINELIYQKQPLRFWLISVLSAVFALTLIDLSVIYTGISPEIGWLVISAFGWLVVNLLLILFRKILLRVGKSSVCSMTASSVDFMIFNLMLAILGQSNYIPSNLVSKLIGATTNFTMHKYWAFSVGGGNFKGQYGRYIMISAISFLLNTGIIHICAAYLGLDPRLGWPIAGFLVWLCWNFVMTRLFVFKIPVFHDTAKKNE